MAALVPLRSGNLLKRPCLKPYCEYTSANAPGHGPLASHWHTHDPPLIGIPPLGMTALPYDAPPAVSTTARGEAVEPEKQTTHAAVYGDTVFPVALAIE